MENAPVLRILSYLVAFECYLRLVYEPFDPPHSLGAHQTHKQTNKNRISTGPFWSFSRCNSYLAECLQPGIPHQPDGEPVAAVAVHVQVEDHVADEEVPGVGAGSIRGIVAAQAGEDTVDGADAGLG